MYIDLAKQTFSELEIEAQLKAVERHPYNEIYVTLNKVPITVTKSLAAKMLQSELQAVKKLSQSRKRTTFEG